MLVDPQLPDNTVRVAANAMRVRFEVLLRGADSSRLRAAGEQALTMIHEVEADLSPYRPESDVFRLNAAPPETPVPVQSSTVRFIAACRERFRESQGAFDPTVGPLLTLWGVKGTHTVNHMPTDDAIARAREHVGMDRMLSMDMDNHTVQWNYAGGHFDPGAAGKGWAIDQACDLLIELGIEEVLIHGGTSSVRVIGGPFRVVLADAPGSFFDLIDSALGVSGVHGQGILINGVHHGHIVNPITGVPVDGVRGAAVTARLAFDADTWSTALLVAPDLLGNTLRATNISHAVTW